MTIIVFPGDGIGPEITAATLAAVRALDATFSLGLEIETHDITSPLSRGGCAFPEELLARARAADGIILGPVDAESCPPAGGGLNPSAMLRAKLALYANLRPSYTRAGVKAAAGSMDVLFVRENTEGFYADRNMAHGAGEFMPTEDVAIAMRKITASGARRIAVEAFHHAMKRRRRVTAVSKANVFRLTDGLFLREIDAVARDYPEVELEHMLVDSMASALVREPERFDVICTTNLHGDILSNEAAALAGGLGLAASLNAGPGHAMAQAAHGAAPEIAGQDQANPAALMLSTAMLLNWLADRHRHAALEEAGACLTRAVDALLANPQTRTRDLGGELGTAAFGRAVAEAIPEMANADEPA